MNITAVRRTRMGDAQGPASTFKCTDWKLMARGAWRSVDDTSRESRQNGDLVRWQGPQEKRFCTGWKRQWRARVSSDPWAMEKQATSIQRSEGNYSSKKNRFS